MQIMSSPTTDGYAKGGDGDEDERKLRWKWMQPCLPCVQRLSINDWMSHVYYLKLYIQSPLLCL